jgi:hypothetical protein
MWVNNPTLLRHSEPLGYTEDGAQLHSGAVLVAAAIIQALGSYVSRGLGRLYGLAGRVLGYRHSGPGFDFCSYHTF